MRDAEDYATYAARMWLMNDEYDYSHAYELVSEAGSVYDGANELKNWLEEAADELLPNASMFTDMLNYMLSSVDWEELARAFKPDEWGDSDEAPEEDEDDED